jgi:imidazolonepropionase-like amidohydrolase
MPRIRLSLFIYIIIVSFSPGSFATGPDLLLTHLNIINPRTRTESQGHLYIVGGKIKKIYSGRVPNIRDAQVMDLTGKYVLPGLQDMHIHNWGDNMPPTGNFASDDYDFVGMEGMGTRLLNAGVTTYLDLFAPVPDTFNLRAKQRAGTIVHPNIFVAGHLFMIPNGHPVAFHPDAIKLNSANEATARVEAFIRARDPDVIKFIYDNFERPDGEYPNMSPEIAQAIINAAHAGGKKAIAHINTWQAAMDLADMGVDAVTHIPEQPCNTTITAKLRDKNVTMITTMAVYTDLGYIADLNTQDEILNNDLLRMVTTAGHIAAYRDASKYDAPTKAWADWSILHNQGRLQFKNLMQMVRDGVKVVGGSDSGNTGTFIAYSMHRELKLMVNAGLSPMEAIRTTTTAASAFMGQNKGVDEGNDADLLIVNANPLSSIANTQDIRMVLLGGSVVRQ